MMQTPKFIQVVDALLATFVVVGAIFVAFFSVASLLLIALVKSVWHS